MTELRKIKKREASRRHYLLHKKEINERTSKRQKEFPERRRLYSKKFYYKNRLKCIELASLWAKNNPDKRRKYVNNRYKTDSTYRLIRNCRNRIAKALKAKGLKKRNNTRSQILLGCSTKQLKQHIESQFLSGMTWDNHSFQGWHIDHIIPLSSAQSLEQLEKLFHYTNLQPLWSKDNFRKSDIT